MSYSVSGYDRARRLRDLERELDRDARECRKVFRDLDRACEDAGRAMERVQARAAVAPLLAVAAGFLGVAGALLAWVLH